MGSRYFHCLFIIRGLWSKPRYGWIIEGAIIHTQFYYIDIISQKGIAIRIPDSENLPHQDFMLKNITNGGGTAHRIF